MCLVKQISPCQMCCVQAGIEHSLEQIEKLLEDGGINEGQYLELMNKAKKAYELVSSCHKKEGCKDLLIDD